VETRLFVRLVLSPKYPECLVVGQVLAIPVIRCTPRPGVWGCIVSTIWSGVGYLDTALANANSPYDLTFFCKANRRQFPGCRTSPPSLDEGSGRYPTPRHVKAPYLTCTPDARSYCSRSKTVASGDTYAPLSTAFQSGTLGSLLSCREYAPERGCISSCWGNNSLVPYPPTFDYGGEYHVPRGSLFGDCGSSFPPQAPPFGNPQCVPQPGMHLCYRPLVPIPNYNYSGWNSGKCSDPYHLPDFGPPAECWLFVDTVDRIATLFGIDGGTLCEYNTMKNCSKFDYEFSALKIPIQAQPMKSAPHQVSRL
jgi:hypothetical protein